MAPSTSHRPGLRPSVPGPVVPRMPGPPWARGWWGAFEVTTSHDLNQGSDWAPKRMPLRTKDPLKLALRWWMLARNLSMCYENLWKMNRLQPQSVVSCHRWIDQNESMSRRWDDPCGEQMVMELSTTRSVPSLGSMSLGIHPLARGFAVDSVHHQWWPWFGQLVHPTVARSKVA